MVKPKGCQQCPGRNTQSLTVLVVGDICTRDHPFENIYDGGLESRDVLIVVDLLNTRSAEDRSIISAVI